MDEVEIKELLLRKYHSLDFMKGMQLDEFVEFLILAINREKKDMIRSEYLALLPFMALRGKYMPFQDFFDKVTGANIDWRPAEEIIAEIDRAHEELKNGS